MKPVNPGLATLSPAERSLMEQAIAEAEAGFSESGLPIGAVLARGGTLLAKGHNRRVQNGDPIAHGEMDCLRNAGRQRTYKLVEIDRHQAILLRFYICEYELP